MKIRSLVIGLAIILMSGCETLEQAMNRAETDINQTALKVHDDASNATAEMDSLANKLSRDTHQEIQSAAAQVRDIATQTIQLTGAEARCTLKYAGMSAAAKLRNIVHFWKKEAPETTALLCSIEPNPIELATNPTTLRISGGWLDASKPKIEMVRVDDQGHVQTQMVPDSARYISVSTEYSESVRLDVLRQEGLLKEDVRTVHLVFPGLRNGLGEIPVVPSPTCTDHTRNGQETDVDCGGGHVWPMRTKKDVYSAFRL